MNRKQTEKIILGLLEQIVEIYKLYDPDGDYLSMAYVKSNGSAAIMVDNCAHSAKCPIDARVTL